MKVVVFFVLLLTSNYVFATPECQRTEGSLPREMAKPGSNNKSIPIEHILVIVQENHSFDNYFGRLNQPEFYGKAVDGLQPEMFNPDERGSRVSVFHHASPAIEDLDHTWDAMHAAWNNGRNDLFATKMGIRSMGYFDQREIPFYYALANEFAIADRYFSSTLGPTYPNRFFLFAGTAFGHTDNDDPVGSDQYAQPTIFDRLSQYGIRWKYYTDYTSDFHGKPGYVSLFPSLLKDPSKIGSIADYVKDLNEKNLPAVVFLDADESKGEDEHPSADIRVGQSWVEQKVQALRNSSYWKNSALFLTYDENGGFFDHVSPPEACAPDSISPEKFNRLGFRVPFIAISPFAKKHYVSHLIYDHSSVLKFIETKFNLPALTRRDANANNLLDLFQF